MKAVQLTSSLLNWLECHTGLAYSIHVRSDNLFVIVNKVRLWYTGSFEYF